MFFDSPVYGWGSGSAGDTLGSAFAGGEHVTPHNILLKFAVEGGLIGLALLGAVVASIVSGLTWRSVHGQLATVSAVGLLAMGITGSAIDTLPVSYLALMLVGLGIGITNTDRRTCRSSLGSDKPTLKLSSGADVAAAATRSCATTHKPMCAATSVRRNTSRAT